MSVKVTNGFEPGDDAKVVSILKKWKGGALSDGLFTQLAGMLPQAGLVATIFRKRKNLEILLPKRASDDIVWPDMLNLPGKQFRASDWHRSDGSPINGPFERIQKDEIKTNFLGEPEFAGVSLHEDDRGPQVVLIYLAQIDLSNKLSEGIGWYEVDKLSGMSNFVQTELFPINIAVGNYLKSIK